MRQLTQTNLTPGNCWQTALACLLDLPAEALPPQTEIEAQAKSDGNRYAGHFSFWNATQSYLQKHHGKSYVQIEAWQLSQCAIRGEHLIIGPTVRTQETLPRILHCVVGRDAQMVWDVHPSRAGLTSAKSFGFLLPTPPDWAKTPGQTEAELRSWREGRRDSISHLCCCPACFVGGEYTDDAAVYPDMVSGE